MKKDDEMRKQKGCETAGEDRCEETVDEMEMEGGGDVLFPDERDFVYETKLLIEQFPELRGKRLPDEVVRAALSGKDLVQAYEEFLAGRAGGENTKTRKELGVAHQNRSAAARAPVHGTSGGAAVKQQGEDDFLRGFNAPYSTY